ncbi:MAG: Ppx/GppA family phosphatase [Firmicutes bacterium]|nr:Ppx/GppA family phosphatase [Bacillota bacterium]
MKRIGIIDLGSNSVRLIIMDIGAEGDYHQIDNVKETVRLVENAAPDGTLDPNNLRLALETLSFFARLCRVRQVDEILAVATAAVRRAPNHTEILMLLERETSIKIRLLTGEEEGHLDYVGVANTVFPETALIIDVGGGSTKLVGYDRRLKKHGATLPFGIVTLTEMFNMGDTIQSEQVVALGDYIGRELGFIPWLDKYEIMVALGGTARTLARIDRRRRGYRPDITHGYEMDAEAVAGIYRRLINLDIEGRRRMPGMSLERADVIVPGFAVINKVLEMTGISKIVTSISGIRNGLLFEYLTQDSQDPIVPSVLMHSIDNLIYYYGIEEPHARHVSNLALSLFDQLQNLHRLTSYERRLLIIASLLHEIGYAVNHENYFKHTFYMLLNARVNGLNHRELVTAAFVAASHERYYLQGFREYLAPTGPLEKRDMGTIMTLALILRLAKSLDKGRSGAVERINAAYDERVIRLSLYTAGKSALEARAALGHGADCKALFKRELEIESLP